MFSEPIQCTKVQVKMFWEDDHKKIEYKVNKWLISHNVGVHDILYKHCFNAWPGSSSSVIGIEREFSAVIIYEDFVVDVD